MLMRLLLQDLAVYCECAIAQLYLHSVHTVTHTYIDAQYGVLACMHRFTVKYTVYLAMYWQGVIVYHDYKHVAKRFTTAEHCILVYCMYAQVIRGYSVYFGRILAVYHLCEHVHTV